MRAYPNHIATKQDFVNLLSMPEFRDRARADLQALADLKDDTVTRATQPVDPHNPTDNWKTETVPNPLPLYKQKGFKTPHEVQQLLSPQQTEQKQP